MPSPNPSWLTLLAPDPLRFVDVGARGGLASRWRALGAGLCALRVEPDPEACAALQAQAPPNWPVVATALAQSAQPHALHVCRAPALSSLFQPNHAWLAQFPCAPQFTVTHTRRLHTSTLDAVLAAHAWPSADVLQLDAQGAELAILQGSLQILPHVIGVEVEVAFAPIYLEQPLFATVDTFLQAQGFELFDLRRYFWKRHGPALAQHTQGQLACGEALYLRPPTQLPHRAALTSGQLLRACAVYALYGQADLALHLLPALPPALQNPVQQVLQATVPARFFRSARLSRWLQQWALRLAPPHPLAHIDAPLGTHN